MVRDITKFFLKNKSLSWLLMALVLIGGSVAYVNMGKLEDAPFTIKQAVVTTSYPGASPMEVQKQVTDILEESIQSLGELYYLKTDNRAGLSKITVYVKKEIRTDEMQQLWDKLRRKVSDVQSKLPAGAGPSVVNDDFGDVLGVFYGLSSDCHTYRELEEQAEIIKNELLDVKDVAKVELFGVQNRTIEVTINPTLLSKSGLTVHDIISAFDKQNKIVDAGAIETDTHRLRVEAVGSFFSMEEIENLTVVSKDGTYFRLGEIATFSESYVHPARSKMAINNIPAVGIAISTVSDGNVVEMSELVKETICHLKDRLPEGFYLESIGRPGILKGWKIDDKLKKEIQEDGLQFNIDPATGKYVYDMDSLSEFDFCQGSGWTYCVNGEFKEYGMSEYKPKDGDNILIRYTLAYGKDIGGYNQSGTSYGIKDKYDITY